MSTRSAGGDSVMQPGWLDRELKAARAEVSRWPKWLQREAGISVNSQQERWEIGPSQSGWTKIYVSDHDDGEGTRDEYFTIPAWLAEGIVADHNARLTTTDTAKERYFLDRDSSSHWYIVPVSRREEWEHWVNLDEDDEAAWDEPDFAQRLGGSPTLVTFKEPEIE